MDQLLPQRLEPTLRLAPVEPATREGFRALIVPRERIERAVEELRDLPAGTRRAMEVIHPESVEPGLGFAPGLSFSINVLDPGETITLDRDNANRVEFCIGGRGQVEAVGRHHDVGKWDTWNIPSMARRTYRCDGNETFVWFSYSNAPLLRKLGNYVTDTGDIQLQRPGAGANERDSKYNRTTAPDIAVLEDGARFRGYEFLTDIEVVQNRSLLWPWNIVSEHLNLSVDDGKRTIMLMYNPATERRNGTTHSFFATITSIPPNHSLAVPKRGHRHSSFACNYHFRGSGSSVVNGERIEWSAGDLFLSAPAWSEHAHSYTSEGATVLTIQDHPLQIGMESLTWQEKMDGPILTLGSEQGQKGYVGPRLAGD